MVLTIINNLHKDKRHEFHLHQGTKGNLNSSLHWAPLEIISDKPWARRFLDSCIDVCFALYTRVIYYISYQ